MAARSNKENSSQGKVKGGKQEGKDINQGGGKQSSNGSGKS